MVHEVRVIVRFIDKTNQLSDANIQPLEQLITECAEEIAKKIQQIATNLQDIRVEVASRLDRW